jgi:ribosomal protein S18 acetylase RimI-like enzyme
MTIEPFQQADVGSFMEMAAAEGWVAEPWEFDFLLAVFPQGCFCARGRDGKGIAFVTALRHDRSGWIGNLIVAEGLRGKGLGEALFRKALEALHTAGVETCWLTASNAGRSLYKKYGFKGLDAIVRWSGTGRRQHAGHTRQGEFTEFSAWASVSGIDCQAWGDRRHALLTATAGRGRLLREESGFMVIQPCGAAMQLGPFSAQDCATAEYLCDAALGSVPRGTRVYIDAPLANRPAGRLFSRRGMRVTGSTELMYAGVKPDYRPEMLYGLATMGSCG